MQKNTNDQTMTNLNGFSRCEELDQTTVHSNSQMQRADTAVTNSIYHALGKDDVLRAIENGQIDVHVKNGNVYLTGHIVNTSNQARIMNAIRTLPGIRVIHNDLVLDEKLTLEVATSLAALERIYDCKFFTGASHGVLSLNGVVSNDAIKMLAEKCAAGSPNVRGVINHVRVSGTEPVSLEQPFLQPVIGETIYFIDGVSGVVKQVIINPNNRRVIAMIIKGYFNRRQLQTVGATSSSEQLIIVSMDVVRYMTRTSAFLLIGSNEKDRYGNFEPASFSTPNLDWAPPYPYCPDDVLVPIEYQVKAVPMASGPVPLPFQETPKGATFREQFLANDSLGG